MKRKIIKIDEDKCNGCGQCTTVCAEAALKVIDGKARLVSDFLCDGMGACLDVCPVDALHVVEEESEAYDPERTYEHVKEVRGEEAAKNVHGYAEDHSAKSIPCGCPGMAMHDFRGGDNKESGAHSAVKISSELRQWPVQLHLLNPAAPYFNGADLVISADCAPFAYANFHQKFLKGKILAIFCPKFDDGQDVYVEKLTQILKTQNIKLITVVRMEVPCCGGVGAIVERANLSGKNFVIKDYTISIQGDIL